MKEFVEKLIERLEEKAENNAEMGYMTAYDVTKECNSIVKQLAEEYNNKSTEHINCSSDDTTEKNKGWILCSERLPVKPNCFEDEEMYLTTVKRDDGKIFVDNMVFHNYGWNILPDFEVLAWKPLPEPYKPEEPQTNFYTERFNRVI